MLNKYILNQYQILHEILDTFAKGNTYRLIIVTTKLFVQHIIGSIVLSDAYFGMSFKSEIFQTMLISYYDTQFYMVASVVLTCKRTVINSIIATIYPVLMKM